MAKPCLSVRPDHTGSPRQSEICTCAPSTGLPLSSVVTHTSELLALVLKCTPRLVTSTLVRTYMGALRSSRAWPSLADSTSTTWKPGCPMGMPMTSKGRAWTLASLDGRLNVLTPASRFNKLTVRVCTTSGGSSWSCSSSGTASP